MFDFITFLTKATITFTSLSQATNSSPIFFIYIKLGHRILTTFDGLLPCSNDFVEIQLFEPLHVLRNTHQIFILLLHSGEVILLRFILRSIELLKSLVHQLWRTGGSRYPYITEGHHWVEAAQCSSHPTLGVAPVQDALILVVDV